MHRLLRSQLRQLGLSSRRPPATVRDWHAFLSLLSESYEAADRERDVLRQSSDRAAAEARQLHSSTEERYRNLFENANDIIYTVDLQGRFTTVNRAGELAVGYDRAGLIGKHYSVIVAPEHVDLVAEMTRRKVQGDQAVHRYEIDIIDRNGVRRTVELNTRLITRDGRPYEVLGLARDVSERKEEERQLRHVAEHDPLTGLPNRLVLQRALRDAIDRADHGRPSVLAFVDLDNFKVVNDSLGHAAGDNVLLNVATLLRGRIRPGDLLVRLGGDEFAVLLRDSSPDDAVAIVDRLRGAITEAPFIARGRTFDLGVSAGLCPIHAGDIPESVLAHADSAMYEAKSRGGNQVLLSDPQGGAPAPVGFSAAAPVEVAYEPVLRPGSDQAVCYLARPLAEETAHGPMMLVYRDRDTIHAVFQALAAEPAAAVFVALSRAGQGDPRLATETIERLKREPQVGGRLGFLLGQDLTGAAGGTSPWLGGLREAEAPVAFQGIAAGIGQMLAGGLLPGDLVTLDSRTAATMGTGARRTVVLAAALAAAAEAGAAVVAGPVQDAAQLELLRNLGIPLAHGPFLAPPVHRPRWDGRLAA